MPNWVINSVYISGDADKVTAMQEKLAALYKGVESGAINFLNLIAPPDDKWDSYNCGPIGFGSETEKDPYNWYSWNIANWGTKWNSCSDQGPEIQIAHDGTKTLGLKFDTAWASPEFIMQALWTLCEAEGLSLDWHWEEEQGFGEAWETQDGEFMMVNEWHIPESHADYVELDKVDSCPCQYPEWEFSFDDCPEVAESVST